MELLRFFLANADLPRRKLIYYSALAGGANVLAIAFLNSAAANAEDQATELFILALFSVDILIYLAAQKFIWHVSTREVENVVNDIRMSLVKKISGCDLESLEKMGRSDIFAAINQHSNVIALSGLPIIISIQSFILLFFTLLYVAYLSVPAFFLIAIFLGIAIWAAMNRSTEAEKLMDVAVQKESSAYAAITDILEGFKEVKLNKDREIGLKQHTENMSLDARDARTFANRKLASNYIATQTSYYLTIAALIFILPMVAMNADNLAESIVKVVTACIFLVSPINTIISVLPSYTSATASLHFINEMNEKLENGQEMEQAALREFPPLQSLELKEVCFSFANKGSEPGFQVGPINLKLEANEIVFFTGGNGSGKTTLIKALIGLYKIKSGAILYNGELVNYQDLASYRNLFTAIFTDFHLFKRFYGLHVDEQEAAELLKLFQLEHKTSFSDGEFITQDLSTGQRKRLALIVSILENRPIMILDEWAADQDPTFRAIFYQQLLPKLKAQGRTILAISHDEQYFDCADERYHIIEGQLATKPKLNKGES